MAELATRERLQPSLLDRLTDNAPEKDQESREQRVLSFKQLKQSVLRDLSWLLNTVALEATEDLSSFPHIANSVLNYGVPDLTGTTISTVDPKKLQRQVKQAIMDFEPRIIANTLKIEILVNPDQMSHSAICFKIEGDLWAQPLPIRLYIRSDLDLETGEVTIQDLG